MKKQTGITLLALIITIIIMLILAGVTISIVGGSDGIVAKAEKAVSQTDKAAQQEDAELSIAAIKMDYYEDYAANRAKYANAKAFIVDKLQTAYKTSRGATMMADAEGNVTYTYKSVATEVTLADDGRVSFGESTGGGTVVPAIPEGLTVGDTVAYSPSGTYNWENKYSHPDWGVEYYKLASGDKVTSSDENMSISSWKVFSIDENTGNVELVPSEQTTGKVWIVGAQGYNNAVKLLNDACSNLYGDSSKGISARSINEDDIQNVMYYEEEDRDFVEYYKTYHAPVNAYQTENYQEIYSIETGYPTIYEQEDLSVIKYYGDTTETKVNIGTGLGRSEQTSFIEKNAVGAVSKALSNGGKITTAAESIRPYGTKYMLNFAEMTNLLGDYADLLLPKGTNTNYWVASRCMYSTYGFCVRAVRSSAEDGLEPGMGMKILCYTDGDSSGDGFPLFPVVSLSAGILSEGTATDWEVK